MNGFEFTGPHAEKIGAFRRELIKALATAKVMAAIVVTADVQKGKTYASSGTVVVATDPVASLDVLAHVVGRALGRAESLVAGAAQSVPEAAREGFIETAMRVALEETKSAPGSASASLVIEPPRRDGPDRRPDWPAAPPRGSPGRGFGGGVG